MGYFPLWHQAAESKGHHNPSKSFVLRRGTIRKTGNAKLDD
jgi:hypothetical protein